MLKRIVGIWLVALLLATALLLENVYRKNRVAEVFDEEYAVNAWEDFPNRLLMSFALITFVVVLILLLGVFFRINRYRVTRVLSPNETAVVMAVRNFQPSRFDGLPLEKIAGLTSFGTILAASEAGFVLLSGMFRFGVRARFSWDSIEEVSAVDLDPKIYKISATGISIKLRAYGEPLRFALASEVPPWIEVGSTKDVDEAAARLQELWKSSPKIAGS